MYVIYNILYLIVLLIILPYQYLKRPASIRNRWLRQRIGLLPQMTQGRETIWIHAVSVGEVTASVPLIRRLRDAYPGRQIVLSTVTDTGQKVAGELAGGLCRIIYIPFDMTFSVASAYKMIRPALFMIMETELWPAIIHYFKGRNVPVLLMNGRISERSAEGYGRLRFFFRRVLGDVSFFCMQDRRYSGRIISLGADAGRVRAIGNLKFDTRPAASLPGWTKLLKGPVIVAGSTHRPEEGIVMDAYSRLLEDYPDLNIVIAPRHPERFREVEELADGRNLSYVKRSDLKAGSDDTSLSGKIVLLDVMGELASVYGAADVAVMGGSFIPHGGQNLLEPAFWGKAIVCGPHMENFPFVDEFYGKGAALQASAEELYEKIKGLLTSPDARSRMGKAAMELYSENSGASDKAIEIIKGFLPS